MSTPVFCRFRWIVTRDLLKDKVNTTYWPDIYHLLWSHCPAVSEETYHAHEAHGRKCQLVALDG